MITLENPPKSGIIYKTVAYLNNKLDRGGPSTGCELFWQSVLLFLFLLNALVVPLVLVDTVHCLGLGFFTRCTPPPPITVEYFLISPCVVGTLVGLLSGILVSTFLSITFSWVGVMLLLSCTSYMVNKHFGNKPFKYVFTKMTNLFKMGKPFWKWLSKFKIKCEEY